MREQRTVVKTLLDVRGMYRASEQNVVGTVLGRRPGVVDVEVNPVAQSANVEFDPARTSVGGPGPGERQGRRGRFSAMRLPGSPRAP